MKRHKRQTRCLRWGFIFNLISHKIMCNLEGSPWLLEKKVERSYCHRKREFRIPWKYHTIIVGTTNQGLVFPKSDYLLSDVMETSQAKPIIKMKWSLSMMCTLNLFKSTDLQYLIANNDVIGLEDWYPDSWHRFKQECSWAQKRSLYVLLTVCVWWSLK